MLFSLLLVASSLVSAETGIDGWLRYARLPHAASLHQSVPGRIFALNDSESSPVRTAGIELRQGIAAIFGKDCHVSHANWHGAMPTETTAVVGTVSQFESSGGDAQQLPELEEDGFWLHINDSATYILGQNERGALYGAFEYLSMLAQGNMTQVSYASNPDAPIRWINQWDNLQAGGTHGSVERGYGGPSIFFANGSVKEDLSRAAQYARLLASIGVNAVVVNNVNANESMLTDPIMDGLGRIADAFRPYGVQLGISLYFAITSGIGRSRHVRPPQRLSD